MMDLARRVKDQLAAVQKAMITARTGVESIRRMIFELQQERERVRSAPVPPDEAVAALDEMLDRWRIVGQEWFDPDAIIRIAATGERPQLVDPHGLTPPVLLRVMMVLLGDQVRAALIAQLEQHYRGVEVGLARDARAVRLTEIDRELAKLEAAEEQAIAAAEEGGLSIDRRGDACVEAVLGIDQ